MAKVGNDEILRGVQEVIMEALVLDDDEVYPKATLIAELGAESIDFLDIIYKLEQRFGIRVEDGELFPSIDRFDRVEEREVDETDHLTKTKITVEGVELLRQHAPWLSISDEVTELTLQEYRDLFTVEALVCFVREKLRHTQDAPQTSAQ